MLHLLGNLILSQSQQSVVKKPLNNLLISYTVCLIRLFDCKNRGAEKLDFAILYTNNSPIIA